MEERKSASLEKSSLEIKSATDDADTSKQPVFNCKHCSQECQSAHNLKTHVLAKHIASERLVILIFFFKKNDQNEIVDHNKTKA